MHDHPLLKLKGKKNTKLKKSWTADYGEDRNNTWSNGRTIHLLTTLGNLQTISNTPLGSSQCSMTTTQNSNGWLNPEPILAMLRWDLEGGSCHGNIDPWFIHDNGYTNRTTSNSKWTSQDNKLQVQVRNKKLLLRRTIYKRPVLRIIQLVHFPISILL
jgi:hypothetical protein